METTVHPYTLKLAVTAGIFALGAAGWSMQPTATPKTLADVTALAETLGLYHASGDWNGVPYNRLVISTMPLTRERAGLLRMNDPNHSCWIGTVAIERNGHAFTCNYDPDCSTLWGEFFVYGDPAVIRKLTGMAP